MASPYAIEDVKWYRCPGEVTYEQHKKYAEDQDGLLDGCFLYVGLKDFNWRVGGRVHCPHCGGHMQSIRPGEVAPKGKEGGPQTPVFIAERVSTKLFKDKNFDPDIFDWGCCMNRACSKHYLEANASDSDSRSWHERLQHSGMTHGASQWFMLNYLRLPDRGEGDGENKWLIHHDEIKKRGQRSWKKCLICGAGMANSIKERMLGWPVQGQVIKKRQVDPDSEGETRFNGPAASFRLYRWSEWKILQKALETPVEVNTEPAPVATETLGEVTESGVPIKTKRRGRPPKAETPFIDA